jgi:transcriptional regulator with XRE-family HTH domain
LSESLYSHKGVPIAYTVEDGDPLSLHSAYLTARQLDVWDLMRKGFTQSDIARKLNISRQAVNQLAQSIPEKVEAALYDASRLNGVDPRIIDSTRGILLGWSKEFETETIITVNRRIGLRVWYHHHLGRCKICPDKKQCQSLLLEHASEYGISLTKAERTLDPSKLAGIIFSKVLGPYDLKSQAIREKPIDRTLTRT